MDACNIITNVNTKYRKSKLRALIICSFPFPCSYQEYSAALLNHLHVVIHWGRTNNPHRLFIRYKIVLCCEKPVWQGFNGFFEHWHDSSLWFCMLTFMENCLASVALILSYPSPAARSNIGLKIRCAFIGNFVDSLRMWNTGNCIRGASEGSNFLVCWTSNEHGMARSRYSIYNEDRTHMSKPFTV